VSEKNKPRLSRKAGFVFALRPPGRSASPWLLVGLSRPSPPSDSDRIAVHQADHKHDQSGERRQDQKDHGPVRDERLP